MQQQYQCVNCGAPVAFGSRFCANCGLQLNWAIQQQSPPPQNQRPQQPAEVIKNEPRIGRVSIAVFVIVGLLINYYSNTLYSLEIMSLGIVLIFQIIGVGFSLYGGYLWAKLKGRHWAWMFTMPLLVGLIVLPILKDRKQGKSTWGITGAVVGMFLVLVLSVSILGKEKLMNVTIRAAIGALPVAIITGLAVMISSWLSKRRKG